MMAETAAPNIIPTINSVMLSRTRQATKLTKANTETAPRIPAMAVAQEEITIPEKPKKEPAKRSIATPKPPPELIPST